MGYCNKCVNQYGDFLYLIFRVLVGVMFFMHGYGKLFGAKAMPLASQMGIVGLLEILVGAAVLLGFYTRLAAVIGVIIMLGAWFTVHAKSGWNPLANGGELALMYLSAFLVSLKLGNGKFSLEKNLLKKETF